MFSQGNLKVYYSKMLCTAGIKSIIYFSTNAFLVNVPILYPQNIGQNVNNRIEQGVKYVQS